MPRGTSDRPTLTRTRPSVSCGPDNAKRIGVHLLPLGAYSAVHPSPRVLCQRMF